MNSNLSKNLLAFCEKVGLGWDLYSTLSALLVRLQSSGYKEWPLNPNSSLSLIPKIHWLYPKYNIGEYWNQNFFSNQNSFFAKYLTKPKFRASSETNSYINKWLYILQRLSHLIFCFILSLTAMLKVRKGRDSSYSKSENRISYCWGTMLRIFIKDFKVFFQILKYKKRRFYTDMASLFSAYCLENRLWTYIFILFCLHLIRGLVHLPCKAFASHLRWFNTVIYLGVWIPKGVSVVYATQTLLLTKHCSAVSGGTEWILVWDRSRTQNTGPSLSLRFLLHQVGLQCLTLKSTFDEMIPVSVTSSQFTP